MESVDQLVQRLTILRNRGQILLDNCRVPYAGGLKEADVAAFDGWKTQVQNYLINLVGPDHIYYLNFDNAVVGRYDFNVGRALEILRALDEDLQRGFLVRFETLISADLLGDFLTMAAHLVDNGYKDASASLIGAVLENGLRRIAVNNRIKIGRRDDLSALNSKCGAATIYTRMDAVTRFRTCVEC